MCSAASFERSPTSARTNPIASCAWSGVATRPVPMAQIGSYAITTSASRSSGTFSSALLDLVAKLALRLAALALLLGLAHAEDRLQPGVERGRHLLLQRAVGLAEELAALGVAEHDAVDAQLGEHRRRHLAGEGARLLLVHVLGEDGTALPCRLAAHGSSAVNGTADADVHVPAAGSGSSSSSRSQ